MLQDGSRISGLLPPESQSHTQNGEKNKNLNSPNEGFSGWQGDGGDMIFQNYSHLYSFGLFTDEHDSLKIKERQFNKKLLNLKISGEKKYFAFTRL